MRKLTDWGIEAIRGHRLIVFLALISAYCFAIIPYENTWEAAPRLLVASFSVLALPGLAVLCLFPKLKCEKSGVVDVFVLGFSISYLIILLESVLVPVISLPGNNIGHLHLAITTILFVLSLFKHSLFYLNKDGAILNNCINIDKTYIIIFSLLIIILFFTWKIESVIEGEAVSELVSIRKLTELDRISFKNILHVPDKFYTYIFFPFPFLHAVIAKISSIPILVSYVKLRVIFTGIALAVFYVFSKALCMNRRLAAFSILALALLIIIDPDPLSWPTSFFTLSRRGSFAAGILLPLCMALSLWAYHSSGKNRLVIGLLSTLLFSSLLVTHTLEAVFFLFWAAGLTAYSLINRRGFFSLIHLAIIFTASLAYKVIHESVVLHVAEYETLRETLSKSGTLSDLLSRFNISNALLPISDGGSYLLINSGAVSFWTVQPMLLLPFLFIFRPKLAALMWWVLVPVYCAYATPIGFMTLKYFTTPEIVFAASYFAPVGMVATIVFYVDSSNFAIRQTFRHLFPLKRIYQQASICVFASTCLAGFTYLSMMLITHFPMIALLIGVMSPVTGRFIRSQPSTAEQQHTPKMKVTTIQWITIFSAIAFVMKLYPGALTGSTRLWLPAQVIEINYSALDWENYYVHLQKTSTPPMDMTLRALHRLTSKIPPQSHVIYDPNYSYALAMYKNIYVLNADHLLSTDINYHTNYVRLSEGRKVHPLFNNNPSATLLDFCFLKYFNVQYVLINPSNRLTVEAKLKHQKELAVLMDESDGFVLWKINRLWLKKNLANKCDD